MAAARLLFVLGSRSGHSVALGLACPATVLSSLRIRRLEVRAQQQRVRDRFPGTPPGELKLLPTGWANRDGRRPLTVSALSAAHRDWITSLPPLLLADGTEYDKDRIIPYAYRHTYAQRHADAGVPIDVLAELLDHRSLNVTRGYYRVGEDRRRAAIDKVTAMQFDRHGNRIWRQARALLDDEHARYAVGSVAVPYGTCTEPSNVAAGGTDCPLRFRCAGCGHFRVRFPCCSRSCCDQRERMWWMSGSCFGSAARLRPPRPGTSRGPILPSVSANWGSGSGSRSSSRRPGGWMRG